MQRNDENNLSYRFRIYLLKKNNNELDKLIANGCCFGLAVTRAVMRISGKIRWWNAALNLITAWNLQEASLDKKHSLPDADHELSLREIFERVITYVVFNQAGKELYPDTGINQFNFLLPGGFFEMLDGNRKLKIKENFRIGGYFSKNDLINILSDKVTQDLIKNNICLVHEYYPRIHTYELGFENKLWTFYSGKGKINYYSDIRLLAEEIKTITKSIIIELACVQNVPVKPFSYYHNLIKTDAARLLQTDSIIHLAEMAPYSLNDLLENVKRQEYPRLNCNEVNREGYYPLHFAVYYPELNITQLLCNAGANVNVFNAKGYTPLMQAAINNNTHAIVILNSRGADPNLISHNSLVQTALMIAVSYSDDNVVKELLNNKNIDLMISVPFQNWSEVENRLKPRLELYCKKYRQNLPDFTALHFAVFLGNEFAVKLLLKTMKEVRLEMVNKLYDFAYILEKKNILEIIRDHLTERLNLKRKPEEDENVRPLKQPRLTTSLFNNNKDKVKAPVAPLSPHKP